MTWRRRTTWCLLVLVGAGSVVAACGSSSEKKKPRAEYTPGGAGGESPAEGGAGNSSSMAAGAPGGGTAGAPAGGAGPEPATAGAGGSSLADAGGAGGAGGAPSAPFHGLYIALTGNDTTGDGTEQAPFATLAKAISVAQSGDTVVYAAGTYDLTATGARVDIPDGVDVMGDAAGVTLQSSGGSLLHVGGSTTISHLELTGFNNPILADGSADLTLVDTSFIDCGGGEAGAIEVTGNAAASVTTSAGKQLGSGNSLAFVHGSATLSIDGGLLKDFTNAVFAGNGILRVGEQGTLNVNDLDVEGGTQTALSVGGMGQAVVTGSTFVLAAPSAVGMLVQSQGELTLDSTDFSFDADVASPYECVRSELDGMGSITLIDTKLHHCSSGVNSTLPGALTLLRTEIYDNSVGGVTLDFGAGGSVSITDSNLHDNGMFGARLGGSGGGANVIDLLVRGSTFQGATEGLRLQGDPTSTWDLGTLADAGGNTIAGNSTGLRSLVPAGSSVSAIGNTWEVTANTDASGHFVVQGAGAKLQISGPADGGKNYNVGYASTLELAENP